MLLISRVCTAKTRSTFIIDEGTRSAKQAHLDALGVRHPNPLREKLGPIVRNIMIIKRSADLGYPILVLVLPLQDDTGEQRNGASRGQEWSLVGRCGLAADAQGSCR